MRHLRTVALVFDLVAAACGGGDDDSSNNDDDAGGSNAGGYTGVLGDPDSIVGDPGEQLASWTGDPTWVVSIFDGDPVLIGIGDITE